MKSKILKSILLFASFLPFLTGCAYPKDGEVFHDTNTILCLNNGNHVQVRRIIAYPNHNFENGPEVYRVTGMDGKEETYGKSVVFYTFSIDVDYLAHGYVDSDNYTRFTFTVVEGRKKCNYCKCDIDYSALRCTYNYYKE
jgi:hypothetical protein